MSGLVSSFLNVKKQTHTKKICFRFSLLTSVLILVARFRDFSVCTCAHALATSVKRALRFKRKTGAERR